MQDQATKIKQMEEAAVNYKRDMERLRLQNEVRFYFGLVGCLCVRFLVMYHLVSAFVSTPLLYNKPFICFCMQLLTTIFVFVLRNCRN